MFATVAAEFTKSRSRHSKDNGLDETKNGAVIRKHLGYAHIPQHFAAEVNVFCVEHLNLCINCQRPSMFAKANANKKDKTRKHYSLALIMTPFEKFASLPEVADFLHPGGAIATLRATATGMSDNAAAE